VRGRYKAQELFDRSNWERVRWQTALLLNVHTKKGSQLRAKDLATFPWEEENNKNGNIALALAKLSAFAEKK